MSESAFLRSEYTDHRFNDVENDLNHVSNHINYRYYTDKQFNHSVEPDKIFSAIHSNYRNLPKSFTKISEYLHAFKSKF